MENELELLVDALNLGKWEWWVGVWWWWGGGYHFGQSTLLLCWPFSKDISWN